MAGGSQTFFSNLFFVWYIPKNQPTDPPKDPFVYLLGSWRLSHLDRELPTTAASSSCIQMHRFSFYSLIRFGSKTFFFLLSSFLIFYIFILFKPHALSVFNNHQDFLLLLFSNNKTPQFHPAPSLGRLANNFYKPTLLTYISFSFRWSIHFDCNNKKKPVGQGSIDWGLSQNKNNKKTCRGTKKNNERVEIDTIPGGR